MHRGPQRPMQTVLERRVGLGRIFPFRKIDQTPTRWVNEAWP